MKFKALFEVTFRTKYELKSLDIPHHYLILSQAEVSYPAMTVTPLLLLSCVEG
jgi:hypothetical protein